MSEKSECTILLFYSNYNRGSLQAKVSIYEFIDKNRHRFSISAREVNYDLEKSLSQQYGVMGTPYPIVFKNENLVRRHFGEITSEEFKSIIEDVSKS